MCPDEGILTKKFHSYGQVTDNVLSPVLTHPLSCGVGTSAISECCDEEEINFRARIILRFSDSKPVLTASRLATNAFSDDELKSIFKVLDIPCNCVIIVG